MRTSPDSAAITTRENATVRRMYLKAEVYEGLLKFAQTNTGTYDLSSRNESFHMMLSTTGYCSGVGTSGTLYVASLDTANSTRLSASSGNTSRTSLGSSCSYKGGFDAAGDFLYTDGTTIKRWSAGSISTWSSASVPVSLVSNASMVRRVDAVMPITGGAFIQVGHYNFSIGVATLEFFYATTSSIQRLSTTIQYPLTGSFVTGFDTAPYSGHCGAATVSSGKHVIVTNDGKRALFFTVTNGIESEVMPIVPIDRLTGNHSLYPTGLTAQNGRLLMSALMKRKMSDDTEYNLNLILISTDGVNWSVGEHSSFIGAAAANVSLASYLGGTPAIYVTALGGGKCYRAPVRYEDNPAVAKTDVSDLIYGVSHASAANMGDSLNLTVNDATPFTAGKLLTLTLGYYTSDTAHADVKIGEFMIMSPPDVTTNSGKGMTTVACMDIASWRMMNWNSNTDFDRWSKISYQDNFKDFSKSLIKSPNRRVTVGNDGLKSVALNDPLVVYTTGRDDRDGIARAIVKLNNVDTYSSTNFGFVFGGSEKGFNVFMFPGSQWTGKEHDRPRVLTSNLKLNEFGDADWGITERVTGLWDSVLTGEFSILTKHPNASASGNDLYTVNGIANMESGLTYELVMRQQGAYVQIYAREIDTTTLGYAAASTVYLIAEWRFTEHAKRDWEARNFWGFVTNTDVPVGTDWFTQAEYGDISLSLTDAQYYNSTINRSLGTGVKQSGNTLNAVTTPSQYHVNQFVRLYYPGRIDGIARIASINTGTSTLTWDNYNGVTPTLANGDVVTIYTLAASEDWGFASSGIVLDAVNGVYDPGAVKRPTIVAGRGLFISEDNSAASARYVESDNVIHVLKSGSVSPVDGTTFAWDFPTNPVPNLSGNNYVPYGGSKPTNWRFLMHHGRMFIGTAASNKLPAGTADKRYMIVNDEIVRFREETFTTTDGQTKTWVVIPTFYTPLAAQSANSTTLTQWNSGANYPGDAFNTIGSVHKTGLLVEILSKNVDSFENSTQYYSTDYAAGPPSTLTIDKPYPGRMGTLEGLAVVSGRAQLGTTKSLHSATDPVCYYPAPPGATAPVDHFINIKQFEVYRGRYNAAEDDLRFCTALAGIRNVTFQSRGSYSGVLGTSPQTLASSEQDFVLDINAHLYTSGNRLRITFRNNYFLDLAGTWPGDITNGRLGYMSARLVAYNSAIATNGGQKYIFRSDGIPISNLCPFGTVSGSTLTEVPSMHQNIRVALRKNILSLEVDGQHIWTWNLQNYDYDGGSNYFLTSGPVTIEYTSSQSETVTARLLDLSSEVENHVIDMGSNCAEAVSFIISERHIYSRVNQDGGMEIGSFQTRTNTGTVTDDLSTESAKVSNKLSPIGHLSVSGAEFGEYVDETWMQQNGYRFAMGSNYLLDSVSDSAREAYLLQRRAKEEATQYQKSISHTVLLIQPEDIVNIDGEDMIVVGINNEISSSIDEVTSSAGLSTRKKYD